MAKAKLCSALQRQGEAAPSVAMAMWSDTWTGKGTGWRGDGIDRVAKWSESMASIGKAKRGQGRDWQSIAMTELHIDA